MFFWFVKFEKKPVFKTIQSRKKGFGKGRGGGEGGLLPVAERRHKEAFTEKVTRKF